MRRSFVLKSLLHCSHSYATIFLAADTAGEAGCLSDAEGVDDIAGAVDMILEVEDLLDDDDGTKGDEVSTLTLERGGVDSGLQT